jgi:hypothetical protein
MAYLPAQTITDIYAALKSILNVLSRPIWTDPTTGKVNINTIGTLSTLSALTTAADVTRVNNVGSATTNQQSTLYVQLYGQERLNWANCVRARIT